MIRILCILLLSLSPLAGLVPAYAAIDDGECKVVIMAGSTRLFACAPTDNVQDPPTGPGNPALRASTTLTADVPDAPTLRKECKDDTLDEAFDWSVSESIFTESSISGTGASVTLTVICQSPVASVNDAHVVTPSVEYTATCGDTVLCTGSDDIDIDVICVLVELTVVERSIDAGIPEHVVINAQEEFRIASWSITLLPTDLGTLTGSVPPVVVNITPGAGTKPDTIFADHGDVISIAYRAPGPFDPGASLEFLRNNDVKDTEAFVSPTSYVIDARFGQCFDREDGVIFKLKFDDQGFDLDPLPEISPDGVTQAGIVGGGVGFELKAFATPKVGKGKSSLSRSATWKYELQTEPANVFPGGRVRVATKLETNNKGLILLFPFKLGVLQRGIGIDIAPDQSMAIAQFRNEIRLSGIDQATVPKAAFSDATLVPSAIKLIVPSLPPTMNIADEAPNTTYDNNVIYLVDSTVSAKDTVEVDIDRLSEFVKSQSDHITIEGFSTNNFFNGPFEILPSSP